MTDVLEVLILRKYSGFWSKTNLTMNFSFALTSSVTLCTLKLQTPYLYSHNNDGYLVRLFWELNEKNML